LSRLGTSPETDGERFNDQVPQILREAAEKRGVRNRAQGIEDSFAASRQVDAMVTLARAQGRVTRRWPAAPALPRR
jgi:ABC-type sugar transport system substrate-binding protein